MDELRGRLEILYEKNGLNERTLTLSQDLDKLVVKAQREALEKWKRSSNQQKIAI